MCQWLPPGRPSAGPSLMSALLLLAIAGIGVGTAHAAEDAARGQALAERLCARCHMLPRQGEKQGLNDIPGFAAIAARTHQSRQGIVAWLRSIPPMMPNHHLTQDEMHALAAFIVTLGPSEHPAKQRRR